MHSDQAWGTVQETKNCLTVPCLMFTLFGLKKSDYIRLATSSASYVIACAGVASTWHLLKKCTSLNAEMSQIALHCIASLEEIGVRVVWNGIGEVSDGSRTYSDNSRTMTDDSPTDTDSMSAFE